MAFDPLSRSTRHARGSLIVASVASLAITFDIAELLPISLNFVKIIEAKFYVEFAILAIIFWTMFAFGFAARVDSRNSERTTLERKYVNAWEKFHTAVSEQNSHFILTESSPDNYKNELFTEDFNELLTLDQKDGAFQARIDRLTGSRHYLLNLMPDREKYRSNFAHLEASTKFWVVDIGMPYVLAIAAIFFRFS